MLAKVISEILEHADVATMKLDGEKLYWKLSTLEMSVIIPHCNGKLCDFITMASTLGQSKPIKSVCKLLMDSLVTLGNNFTHLNLFFLPNKFG